MDTVALKMVGLVSIRLNPSTSLSDEIIAANHIYWIFAQALCDSKFYQANWEYNCGGVFDEVSLKRFFREDTSSGNLGGNHWNDHGRLFVGVEVNWQTNKRDRTNV